MSRKSDKTLTRLAPMLLAWFDTSARTLPWRSPRGVRRDPYCVWLSEIMLQQTTVPHAAPYFTTFTARWPTVEALAAAKDEDVMQAWAGLGYYARARNLLKCAREVAARGGFPGTEGELLALPGIGPYTAGAIAALAFGERAPAVDGNAERVFARLLAMTGDWAAEKKRIGGIARDLVPADRPGDFAEALMDLGATVCTPKSPNCPVCPLTELCLARAEGAPERYPVKPVKIARPVRFGSAYVLRRMGQVWLVRRPPSGLLGGMLALPGPDWSETRAPSHPPLAADWTEAGEVRHVFTHFSLQLTVWTAQVRDADLPDGFWAAEDQAAGLPTVFSKAAALGGISVPRKR
ncbi:A/G-specific adenine glycosylase [Hyphomonas sp.]|uniref:A/G-specific adenine glycosylase n=1 Tax=Hyphomonas sp. TaxID=87 RepID=UPI00391D62CD